MPSWNWGEEADDEGMVHQAVANTDNDDATKLKQGYDYQNFSEIGPDPVACYPLHEDSGTTAYDLAGNNDGTHNGPTLGQTGLLGATAPNYDGVDDFTNLGDVYQAPTGGSVTISAWYNPSAYDQNATIVSAVDTGNNFSYVLRSESDGNIHFIVFGISGSGSGSGPAVGEWGHVAATYDGSTTTLYINGVEVDSRSGSASRTPDRWDIGFQSDSGGEYGEGRIADVRVYDQALTQSQIQTLYNVVDSPGDWLGTGKVL